MNLVRWKLEKKQRLEFQDSHLTTMEQVVASAATVAASLVP
jgi:hypothetical protein